MARVEADLRVCFWRPRAEGSASTSLGQLALLDEQFGLVAVAGKQRRPPYWRPASPEIKWGGRLVLGLGLGGFPQFLRREKGRRNAQGGHTEQIVALIPRTCAGDRKLRDRAAIRWLRMRVVAALAGAGPVFAAAGSLRAVPIVLANVRIFAFALVAMTAVRAVVIDTAFGADTRSVIKVVAADQAIAAVELRTVIGSGHATRMTFAVATIALGRAGS